MKNIFITTLLLLIGFTNYAQQSGKYSVKNLAVNTEYSDFGTSFYKNKQIVFASPKEKTFWSTITKNVWKPNGQRFLDIYTADTDVDGELINKTQLNPDVNSKYHEATVAFTNDFKTVYFTRNNYYDNSIGKDSTGMTNLALYSATVDEDGKWTNITPLPFNNKDYSVGHPALSTDNKKLYFVSDMPGGKGKTDIYVVDILGNNTFSKAVNLDKVNTAEQEMFPYIAKNNIMYYSSNAKGLGGLDIFAYNFNAAPISLAAPLNSASDDFAFIIDSDKKAGYLSSNRAGGKGDDDIYYFTEDKPIEFECKQFIVLNVVDSETKKPLNGAQLNVFKNGTLFNESTLDASGSYKTETKCKEDYTFKASLDKYVSGETSLRTSERNEYTNTLELALKPVPEVVVKPEPPRYILGPVYFDFDKYNIRKSNDADAELDRIVGLMNQNPNLIVSIESFTDARGDDVYNKMLSQNRANETKKYMVNKGIAEDRITGVLGRGEELPVNQCTNGVKCTENEHQLNRRTEFVVVKQ